MTMTVPTTEREEHDANFELAEGVRVYRGRSLAELLPRIRAELGPEAVVLRQREGRAGGIGGFFAQRYFEVEAMAVVDRRELGITWNWLKMPALDFSRTPCDRSVATMSILQPAMAAPRPFRHIAIEYGSCPVDDAAHQMRKERRAARACNSVGSMVSFR